VKQEHEGSPRKVGFDDSKDQQLFASLEVLRKAAWDSYDKRREFEWRIALALWAGMGAFGALTVAKDSLLRGPNVVLFASAMALALLGLHVSFLRELTRRNRFDSHTSYEYEAEMRKLIHWSFLDKTLDEERELVKKQHRSIMTNYSPRFQVSVTFLLGVIIVGALLWKSMQIDPIR
jgi:hypothetical protein